MDGDGAAPVPNFVVTPTYHGGCRVLVLEGELDMTGAERLDVAIDTYTDGHPLVVDLSGLVFIDSTGLHTLLRERRVGRPNALVRTRGSSVDRVLDIVEIRRTIPIYDDVATAAERLVPST